MSATESVVVSPLNPIRWMTSHRVTANLLMLLFIIGGLVVMHTIRQEVFPEIVEDVIQVSVAYPGASPKEIETGILQSIEAEIRGIEGVKQITSEANEGRGVISAELFDRAKKEIVLQDVKDRVDSIRTLPLDAENPQVSISVRRRIAISLMVYGEQNNHSLRQYAENVKNELMSDNDITLVELASPRNREVAIEVPQFYLEAIGLSMPAVARQINQYALESPAGALKSQSGEILFRITERQKTGLDFSQVPVKANKQGGWLPLDAIADVQDGFEDSDQLTYFNGQPAMQLNIYSVGDESPIQVAQAAKLHVLEHEKNGGAQIKLAVFEDRSEIYHDRIQLLVKNAGIGLILVIFVLGIFLNARLAFWVMLGIPISMVGAFVILQFTGATLNMVSLFAFIITLGIVVDDAVIVGEAIYEKRQQGMPFIEAAIAGASDMAMPICFAVLTNMVTFLPLMFVPGVMGDIFGQIPAVVISVLFVSLVESLFILPAHLSHDFADNRFWQLLNKPQQAFGKWFEALTHNQYKTAVEYAISNRYITIATCVALLILSVGAVKGGLLKFSFLPKIDRDQITATASLPYGVPIIESEKVMDTMVRAANDVIDSNGGPSIVKGIYSAIGEKGAGSHEVKIMVSLVSSDQRDLGGMEFANLWREAVPPSASVRTMSFSGQTGMGRRGAAIQVELSHENEIELKRAAIKLAQQLSTYEGVIDVDNGIELGKQQFDLTLKPYALMLGLNSADIAAQIRGSFYGIEAVRQQRGENEIKVMVRLPLSDRTDMATIQNLRIQTPTGEWVALIDVVDFTIDRAYTKINRTAGARVLAVTADVESGKANIAEITSAIASTEMPQLTEHFPGLRYQFEGQETTRSESLAFLKVAFLIALLLVYVLLAIPFNDYFQPVIVMLSIPFGVIGAVIGHLLLGFDLSIISMIGIIGLSGIVINDSLVLIITLNRLRETVVDPCQAAVQASMRRFRPILLTSLTTFIGLMPMLFETSVQARFLIPMAISISFGILFATVIILGLVPSLYMVVEDLKLLKKS